MSRSTSSRRSQGGQGRTTRPAAGGRSIRTSSLVILVGVVFVVALLMVGSLVGFIHRPDPAVKAGPMYFTLAFTTGATLLMLFLALNASFFRVMSPQRTPSVQLVMWAMGGTGIVTGLLTVGKAASPVVMRFLLATIAYAFITIQQSRLARARRTAPAGQPDQPAARAQQRPRSRQRRGGRKH
jgi:hypothetical protein